MPAKSLPTFGPSPPFYRPVQLHAASHLRHLGNALMVKHDLD
jgi:hypothetical protein